MSQYDRVLVPTDGSDGVEEVIAHAVGVARDGGGTVHALSVMDRRIVHAAEDARETVLDRLRERSEAAVATVAERASAAGLETVTAVREGVPDEAILDYAAEAGVDLVVMGTHGRTGRDRIVNLGSVTDRVVERAECPVLVVQIGRD